MTAPVGGLNVPAEPPDFLLAFWIGQHDLIPGFKWNLTGTQLPLLDNGEGYSGKLKIEWPGMTLACFNSAMNADVFLVRASGPRGGKRYRVASKEKWAAWRAKYLDRVSKIREAEARKRLGG